MNRNILALAFVISSITLSCETKEGPGEAATATIPLIGTWKLITGTLIEKGDTTVTDFTKQISFIKIINDSHFGFFSHDVNKGKDSSAMFSSGGGTYTLKDSTYTEHLEYCTAREWEGHDFTFTLSISNDTLMQSGREKIESEGIDRINIEKYVRVEAKR